MVPAPLLRRALISQEITPALVSFQTLSGIKYYAPHDVETPRHGAHHYSNHYGAGVSHFTGSEELYSPQSAHSDVWGYPYP